MFGLNIGDRVILKDPHPWDGYTGTVEAFEPISTLAMNTFPKVRMDEGGTTFITRENQYEKTDKED